MYCAERSTPSEVAVEAATTKFTLAPGATAPDHSTSSVDSSWSPETNPGLAPSRMTVGWLTARPEVERKLLTSVRLILLRPTMAIDVPEPFLPAVYCGLR